MTDMREAVARIIDPSTWAVLDSYLADVKRKYAKSNAGYDPEAFKDRKSLAKAAEIEALMQPEIDRRAAEERAKLLERLREPSEENAREWFHVVVMDDETYGIKDNGGSMSFPWSKDRADTWLLKDAINRAIDFSVRQKSLVPPSSGHLPPEKENSDEQG